MNVALQAPAAAAGIVSAGFTMREAIGPTGQGGPGVL